MDANIPAVSPEELLTARRQSGAPLLIDVRRTPAFRSAPDMMEGALRRDPADVAAWARELPTGSTVVVYCVHGHEVSQNVAKALIANGHHARYAAGGIEAMHAAGGGLMPKPKDAATRWITRERPKVDRIACPWLVSRFIDRDAEFLYVPATEVRSAAVQRQAIPYDIPSVPFSHDGDQCSFDAFIRIFHLNDPALLQLAAIVRGADTDRPDLAPQAAGLVALSLGLSLRIPDDHEMLRAGMILYDALYLWCKRGRDQRHNWNPEACQ